MRQIANSAGTLIYRQNFDLFGNLLGSTGDSGSSYGYAGEWADGTGLQNLRARYYAPQQGRFTNRDPFPGILTEPASLTPYTYALNNPVMYTDPSGETPLLLLGILGGLLGGTAYGYGSQVIRNFSQGICFWNAFSYNIDAGQIALFAGVGTVMGLGMGGAMVGATSLVGYLGIGTSIHQAISADGDLTNEIRTGINTVYVVVQNGLIKYIGITNDFSRRAGEHLKSRNWIIEPIQGLEKLSRFDAKAVEQVLIEKYGLINLENQINSIAKTSLIYKDSISRGLKILRIIGNQ